MEKAIWKPSPQFLSKFKITIEPRKKLEKNNTIQEGIFDIINNSSYQS